MKITRAERLAGEVQLPGDKSISHRSAMFAAIADGTSTITNYAASADCASTLGCLSALGVDIKRNGGTVVINGRGKYGLLAPATELDCGNSGTTMRLISGILAGQPFVSTLTGDESLRSRPMRRIIAPLEMMGASVESNGGTAPLTVRGRKPLRAIEYETPVPSAQIKSCVLLGGVYADGDTTVTESVPTRDHTERMLNWFGVDLSRKMEGNKSSITVPGTATLTARDFIVPGDISAAAFFLVAAACLPGSDIVMPNVGYNATRAAVCDVLLELGANVEIAATGEQCNEPVTDIRIRGGLPSGGRNENMLRGKTIANLIDEIPVLAVLGTQLENGLEIRDAAELRVKETDRIAAVCHNLQAMGASVEEYEDGFRVNRSRLTGTRIESFGDHRIAMSFAVAGLLADGETEISGAECAAVSFPDFFQILASVVQ